MSVQLQKYDLQSKPVNAIKITEENFKELAEIVGGGYGEVRSVDRDLKLEIYVEVPTPNYPTHAPVGYILYQDTDGNWHYTSEEVFNEMYQLV